MFKSTKESIVPPRFQQIYDRLLEMELQRKEEDSKLEQKTVLLKDEIYRYREELEILRT